MKKIIALFIAFASFSCTQAQKSAFSSVALNEKLLAANDSQVAFKDVLKKHKGKTVVIEVWASWCGDCVKAMPKLKELQANGELKAPKIKIDSKDFGIGAQILHDLDISKIRLVTNTAQGKRVGMIGYGLEITEYVNY